MSAVQLVVGIVSVALMFLLLVGPHEAGHFAFAKLFGIRVHEYSLGLGNKLWSTTRGGTLYAFRMFPVGGFVRLAGMEPGDYEADSGFHSKPAWQRLLVLAGGPLVNFLMAALIMTGVFLTQLNSDPGKVSAVIQNGPAYSQGLRPGDSIREVNGVRIGSPDDLRRAEDSAPGQPMALTVARPDGSSFRISVTPQYDNTVNRYLIGIQGTAVVGPLDALRAGVTFPWYAAKLIVSGMGQLFSGQIPGGFFGPNGATGPIGIGYVTYHAATEGLASWLSIAALLSMALGIANLLPLPALDGGRMVVVLAERLRGRPFDREREMQLQRVGLLALLGLMAVIAFFDVQRLATGEFPGMR